ENSLGSADGTSANPMLSCAESSECVTYVSGTNCHPCVRTGHCFQWSGQQDLNLRPPVPKTDSDGTPNLSFFNGLCFKGIRRAFGSLVNRLDSGSFGIYVFIYARIRDRMSFA